MLNIFGKIYFKVLVLMGKRPEWEIEIKEGQTLILDKEKDEWVWV